MAKQIGYLLLLLLLIWGLDKAVAFTQDRLVMRSKFRYSRLCAPNRNSEADILLLGNSRGLTLFEPSIRKITHKRTLNLSYNGLPITVIEALARDYVDRYGAPKHTVIEITHQDRDNPALTIGFSCYINKSKHLRNLIAQTDPQFYFLSRIFHCLRYNNEVFLRTLNYLKKDDTKWLVNRVMTAEIIRDTINIKPYTIEIKQERLDKLKSLTDMLQAKGSSVHLVINPFYPAFRAKMTNLDELSRRVTAVTGLQVHDYSRFLHSPQHFSDYKHINQKGADVLMQQMVTDLGLGR